MSEHANSAFEDPIDDTMFDPEAVAAGAWGSGPYGAEDTLGTYREVTSAKTARALAQLDLSRPIATFNLADTMFSGYPAYAGREYVQHLVAMGFDPGDAAKNAPTLEMSRTEPPGVNWMSSTEERIRTTYNLGSKVNGLTHTGVGPMFYGGRSGQSLIADHGVAQLDTTTWGPPLVTRGLLIDVLSHFVASDRRDALSTLPDGRPVITDGYRITVADLEGSCARQSLPDFEAGDVILIRMGWVELAHLDPQRFLVNTPGPYLAETRWMARHRPAMIGIDSWMYGSAEAANKDGALAPSHQLLLCRWGIRLAEGFRFEDLAAAGVDRFVFCHAALPAVGATSSNAPATAIANVS